MKHMQRQAILLAIKRAGGHRALGRALGISHQAISRWKKVPSSRVLEIERLSGVPRELLRPDLYPPDERRQPRP
jgi:DNA-binding transcriptional regulator YdaS (Cro superfamily)